MDKGKAFILVGHKNWGKSLTLRALTNDSRYEKTVGIGGHTLIVRRMSNDDIPKSFIAFVEKLDPLRNRYVIAPLCPDFETKQTTAILIKFCSKYELFFWVLKSKYNRDRSGREAQISDAEIDVLKQFGIVEVFAKKRAENSERAVNFKSFIKKFL